MQLIGMLDSPYVRRVAVSLQLLGLPFEHRAISVFRGVDEFRAINPLVKAPTLVCDDGGLLVDSTLIIDHAEAIATAGRSLMPTDPVARRASLQVVGLALAACEKSVQVIYEHRVRPPEKLHAPWLDRITGQLLAACGALEQAITERPLATARSAIGQDAVTAAIAWRFVRGTMGDQVDASAHPSLVALSEAAEALPEFMAAPHGETEMGRFGGA